MISNVGVDEESSYAGTKAGPITSTTSGLISASVVDNRALQAYIESRELVETSLNTSTLTSFDLSRSLDISQYTNVQRKEGRGLTHSNDKRCHGEDQS